ncbi:MAG: TetR/AcrR family transcriptional regulator [Lactobacillus sp.]|jgi:AcrR family transcriptional regulator|nr:TetR/AcrR family transcriptional regulator [Lactobacillus sp.]MCI2032880.1 TetR/AcrR family transcriptional regulator [Lactobacillus sp.]
MTTTHPDLRFVRTENAIKKAFEEMISAGIRPIQVTELAKRAGINRKTFYSHYDTIDELASSYISAVQQDLYQRLNAYPIEDYLRERGLLIGVFADFFSSNQDFYTSILFQEEYWPNVRRVQDEITTNLAKRYAQAMQVSMDQATLIVTFSCSTMLTMLRLKADGRIQLSAEEIREKIAALNIDGLRGAMGLNI